MKVHHKIGFYLTVRELKIVSSVSWQLFHCYSYPLTKNTVTNVENLVVSAKFAFGTRTAIILKNVFRKELYNIKIKASLANIIRKLKTDNDLVRYVQIILDEDFTGNIFKIFPKLRFLTFHEKSVSVSFYEVRQSKYIKTLKLFNESFKKMSGAVEFLTNFQRIRIKVIDVTSVKSILERNASTLEELYIVGTYKHENLKQLFPDGLRLKKLNIVCNDKKPRGSYSHLKIFDNLESFALLDTSLNEFNVNMFPFLTIVSLFFEYSMFNALNNRWQFSNLKELVLNYKKCVNIQCIENIDAPNLETITIRGCDSKIIDLNNMIKFPKITKVVLFNCAVSILATIKHFTQNFEELKYLEIRQSVATANEFEELLEIVAELKYCNPISSNFQKIRIQTGLDIAVLSWKEKEMLNHKFQEWNKIESLDLNIEGYRLYSYPKMNKWFSQFDGPKIEIIYRK